MSIYGYPELESFFGEYADTFDQLLTLKEHEIYQYNLKGMIHQKVVEKLPDIKTVNFDCDSDRVRIGHKNDVSAQTLKDLELCLLELQPWRKGPFDIFGILLDSEWDSSIKWNRLNDKIASLKGKRVLDIGSSCGYYMFRMLAKDPALVVGIEPYLTFYFQFLALQKYLSLENICCLPIKLEEMPLMENWFDTIFCMGILYHRRSPLDTLIGLRQNLKKGGELILETLIIPGDDDSILFPVDRYAKMRNVYFIPTVKCLATWLARTGFTNIRCIDVSKTTLAEQRKTIWVNTESLADFLDPDDENLTIEGYPAPIRAVMLANA